MREVFLLWHTSDIDDEKLLGVYSSFANAEAARARLGLLPGFVDQPSGFEIVAYELDVDQWVEGFVTIDIVEVPLLGSDETCTTNAERLANGLHQLLPAPGATEQWMFQSGQIVRCVLTEYPDGTSQLVAVQACLDA